MLIRKEGGLAVPSDTFHVVGQSDFFYVMFRATVNVSKLTQHNGTYSLCNERIQYLHYLLCLCSRQACTKKRKNKIFSTIGFFFYR